MFYINCVLVFFKLFLINFEYFIKYTSYKDLILLLMVIISLIVVIKYVKNIPHQKSLLDHVMWYRFDYDLERYYSLFIVQLTFILYTTIIIYLRILSSEKTVDLIKSKNIIFNVIQEQPLLILFTLLSILFLGFYLVFILIAGCIRKYVSLELIKLHFFYLDKPFYEKMHNKFKFSLSVSGGLHELFMKAYRYLYTKIALGYQVPKKNEPFRLKTEEEWALIEKTFLWRYVNTYYVLQALYNLHYIILLLVLSFDVLFNNLTIQYTFKVLPYLFVYQLYVMASRFVNEKPLTDICDDTNLIFYHKVVIFDDKFALIDDQLTEPPSNWHERFLEYEASGFTKVV
jgi:hypothetical protein